MVLLLYLFNGCVQPLAAYIYASAVSVFNNQYQELLDSTKFWNIMIVVLTLGCFISDFFKNYDLSAAGEFSLYIFCRN